MIRYTTISAGDITKYQSFNYIINIYTSKIEFTYKIEILLAKFFIKKYYLGVN